MIPRLHSNLLLLVFNSDKEILVIGQIPYLSLTTSFWNNIHQINRPLTVVVYYLEVVEDVVAFVEGEDVVDKHAEATIIICIAKCTAADIFVIDFLQIINGRTRAACLSCIRVFNVEANISNKFIFALGGRNRRRLNRTLFILNLGHNYDAIFQNQRCAKCLP